MEIEGQMVMAEKVKWMEGEDGDDASNEVCAQHGGLNAPMVLLYLS